MTNNKKLITLIFSIFIILTIITVWLVVYSLDNNRITPYPDETYVGYVYIGGKNTWQAENALRNEINEWLDAENLKIELSYQEQAYKIDIDPEVFYFNVDKSIQNVKEAKKMDYDNDVNVVIVEFSEGNENYIENLLTEHYDELKFSDFNVEIIKNEVLKNVSFLFKEIYIDLGIAIDKEVAKITPIGDPIEIKTNQADYIHTRRIDEIIGEPFVIPANSQFSLNDFLIEVYSLEKNQIPETKLENINDIYKSFFTKDELNIIASGIYQTIFNTNLKNISKHISKKLPGFISQAGLEASLEIGYDFVTEERLDESSMPYTVITQVDFTNLKDLTFYNPNSYPLYIEVTSGLNESNQSILIFQLYGPPFINTYEYEFLYYSEIIQGETLWPDPNVAPGDKELVDPGYSGYRSVVSRKTTITYPDSKVHEVNTILTEDIYMPKDAIFKVFGQTSSN